MNTATATTADQLRPDGQDFRDDTRRRRRPLPPDALNRLTTINTARATLAVGHTVLAIVVLIAVGVAAWTPWVVIPVIILIASRQQACFVLLHEAAHYRLYRQRWLNDLMGRALGTITGISMCSYRIIHRLHHNHLYDQIDPDIPLFAGYPRGPAYLARKLVRDLTGFTAYKTYNYFFGTPKANTHPDAATRLRDDTSPALRDAAARDRWVIAAFHVAAPIIAFASGYGIQYLVLWVLPAVTVLQAILRFRAICEHGAVDDLSSPLTAARTNLAPGWLRWFLFPHNVNYHVEHHLYPAIPQYHLPACHRLLRDLGALDQAEVRRFADTARRVIG